VGLVKDFNINTGKYETYHLDRQKPKGRVYFFWWSGTVICMNEVTFIGNPPIAVTIRRSARARKYSLRISNTDGQINLTVPRGASVTDALDFASQQEGWLRNKMSERPSLIPLRIGGEFVLEGKAVRLVQGTGRRVVRLDGALAIPGNAASVGARVRGYCKVLARERLANASQFYATKLDVSFGKITLRDTKTRWGSCSAAGNLMYSWRLILAPAEVLDYVAAHEVAHLRELNHSAAYWAIVRDVCPTYQGHRDWLRKHGTALHRYRF